MTCRSITTPIVVALLLWAAPCAAQQLTPEETLAQIQKLLLAAQAQPQPVTAPDYTPLLQSIIAAQKQLIDAQTQALAVEKDTNAQVTLMNKTFAQTMASVGSFVGKYIAPAVLSFIAAKRL